MTIGINKTASRWLAILWVLISVCAWANPYYVCTTGSNSSGDGSEQNPWQTIQYGVEQLGPGHTLYVRGGRYFESVWLSVSGTESDRIVIQAYEDEEVILDGTAPVTGWTRCSSDEAGLTLFGVTNTHATEIWKAQVHQGDLPDVPEGTSASWQVFEDAVHSRISRWPNQTLGYGADKNEWQEVPSESFSVDDRIIDDVHLNPNNSEGFFYPYINGLSAANLADYFAAGRIHWYQGQGGNYTRRTDTAGWDSNAVLIASGPNRDWNTTDRYSIIEHPHALSGPGEYFYTKEPDENGYHTFYIWPAKDTSAMSEQDIADYLDANITLPTLYRGFHGRYVDYVTIDGFKVVGYRDAGIYFDIATGSLIRNDGVWVDNCIVQDCGGNGIVIMSTTGGRIKNCSVWRVGGRGAFISGGTYAKIQGCDIGDSGRSNISIYGTKNSQIIDNRMYGSAGVHGNGSACYLGCENILVARNIYYNRARATFQNIVNFVVFANIFDGHGSEESMVATWPDSSNSNVPTSGYGVYINNTIIRASRRYTSIFRLSENYAYNNLIGGSAYWHEIDHRSHNGWIGRAQNQRDRDNWELGNDAFQWPTGSLGGEATQQQHDSVFVNLDWDQLRHDVLDYRLAGAPETNPAIGSGTNFQAFLAQMGITETFSDFDFTKDADGNPWGTTPSLGAYEYNGESMQKTAEHTLRIELADAEGNVLAVNQEHAKGRVVVEPQRDAYIDNETVRVEAVAATGHRFSHWEGDLVGTDAVRIITMDRDKTIRAVFERVPEEVEPESILHRDVIDRGGQRENDFDGFQLTGPMTFSARIKLDSKTSFAKIFVKPHTSFASPWEMYAIDLGESGDTPRFVVTDGAVGGSSVLAWDNGETRLEIGEWYHLVGVYDGSRITLYVNATPVASQAVAFQIGTNTRPLWIGSRDDRDVFDGKIHDVNIFAGAMSPSQVDQLYRNPYTLTVGEASNGTVDWTPRKGSYVFDEEVTLTATPNANYAFDGWQGDVTSTANPLTLTIQGDTSVSARFRYDAFRPFTLNVEAENGTVVKSLDLATYGPDDEVTLTATASDGYAFAGWTGVEDETANPLLLTMTRDMEIRAVFEPETVSTYTVSFDLGGGALISGNLSQTVAHGGSATAPIVAPPAGYELFDWEGSYTNVTSDRTITAQYNVLTYTVAFQAGEYGSITSGNAEQYIQHGAAATAPIISAHEGWAFSGWDRPFSEVTEHIAVTAVYEIVQEAIAPAAHWVFDAPRNNDFRPLDVVAGLAANWINEPDRGDGWPEGDYYLRLDGGRQALQVPMSRCSPERGTIAMRVRHDDIASLDNPPELQVLFGHAVNNPGNQIALYTVTGVDDHDHPVHTLALGIGQNDTNHDNIAQLVPEHLYHIVLTWNGTTYAVFVDGVQEAAGEFGGLTQLEEYADVGNLGTAVGRELSAGFRGIVDEVRMYSRALVADEIAGLFLTHPVRENRPIEFIVNGYDDAGIQISYTAEHLPEGATFDVPTQTFFWRPVLYNAAGDYELILTAPGQERQTIKVSVQNLALSEWYKSFLERSGLH